MGAYPQATPCTPGDLAATLFSALGIDPNHHFEDTIGRNFPTATGRVIEQLYG
jgi:hypothetical protein